MNIVLFSFCAKRTKNELFLWLKKLETKSF